MGSQRVGQDRATELNWNLLRKGVSLSHWIRHVPAERFGPGVGPHRGRIPVWLLAPYVPVGELCDVGSLSFTLGSEVARTRAGL